MSQPLSQGLPWETANVIWAQSLNPIIANPSNNTYFLNQIKLKSGVNVINHGLGRLLNGWIITDINAAATIYRSAPLNNLTLTLTSSAAATVNIEVF
jgi:hypothetical protein